MGNCNCKGKKKQQQVVAPQPIDMLVGFELILNKGFEFRGITTMSL